MAGAEVVGVDALGGADAGEGFQMPLGEVDDVDVVAHAGAVGGRVIVAVDREALELAGGHLGDIGEEVIRDAVRVLADEAALVGADGVEVAQQRDAPVLVRHPEVAEDVLDHQLGRAVGVGGREGEVLPDRDRFGRAVNSGGGAEDQVLDPVFLHQLTEDEGAGDVVVVVAERLGDAFADRLEAREMDDRVDLGLGKDLFKTLAVEEVDLVEFEVLAGDLADAVEGLGLGVDKVVDNDEFLPAFEKLDAGVGADIAGAAGD